MKHKNGNCWNIKNIEYISQYSLQKKDYMLPLHFDLPPPSPAGEFVDSVNDNVFIPGTKVL